MRYLEKSFACVALSLLCQRSYSYILCSSLDPSLPSYQSQLALVIRDSGLKRLTKDDELAIMNICHSEGGKLDELIDSRHISSARVSALKLTLVTERTTGRPPTTAIASTLKIEVSTIDSAIDEVFTRWSGTWWSDRYISKSAHVEEQASTAEGLIARGSFSFSRSNQKFTIPLAVMMTKANGQYAVANLCYNDVTTGMTDCTASGTSSASSRLMGAVIIGGILSGMSGEDSIGGAPCNRECQYQRGLAEDRRRERHEESIGVRPYSGP